MTPLPGAAETSEILFASGKVVSIGVFVRRLACRAGLSYDTFD